MCQTAAYRVCSSTTSAVVYSRRGRQRAVFKRFFKCEYLRQVSNRSVMYVGGGHMFGGNSASPTSAPAKNKMASSSDTWEASDITSICMLANCTDLTRRTDHPRSVGEKCHPFRGLPGTTAAHADAIRSDPSQRQVLTTSRTGRRRRDQEWPIRRLQASARQNRCGIDRSDARSSYKAVACSAGRILLILLVLASIRQNRAVGNASL